jgi:hypothetical protein
VIKIERGARTAGYLSETRSGSVMTDIGPGFGALDRHDHVNRLAYNFRSWEKKAG